jgi:coiled-coil domain-containing protein 39
LDKNAEEFKKHHEERHTLFLQWQEVTENISRRDQAIVDVKYRVIKGRGTVRLSQVVDQRYSAGVGREKGIFG